MENGRRRVEMTDLEIERRFHTLQTQIQDLSSTTTFMVTRVQRVEAIFWRSFWAFMASMTGTVSFLMALVFGG